MSSTSREKGLAFEEQVVTLMRSLNCELLATQQSQDGGIDHQVRSTAVSGQFDASGVVAERSSLHFLLLL